MFSVAGNVNQVPEAQLLACRLLDVLFSNQEFSGLIPSLLYLYDLLVLLFEVMFLYFGAYQFALL